MWSSNFKQDPPQPEDLAGGLRARVRRHAGDDVATGGAALRPCHDALQSFLQRPDGTIITVGYIYIYL